MLPSRDDVAARAATRPPMRMAAEGDAAAVEAAERALLAGLPLPGKARLGMPAEPTLTADERGVERTELHQYSRFAPPSIDASVQLRALAAAVNAADAHRGGVALPSGGKGWVLEDRLWTEELSPDQLAQALVDARATSVAGAVELTSYHARDDVLLLARHVATPAERLAAAAWRCPLYDKVDRGFGGWHAWLMRGGAADTVPHAPPPPSGGLLFSMAEGPVDLLRASTSLYASDGFVVTSRPTADTHTATLSSMGGASGLFGRLSRPAAAADPPPPSRLELSFGDGARALSQYTDGEFSTAIALGDGLLVELSAGGTVRLSRAATLEQKADAAAAAAPPKAPAATLRLRAMKASGGSLGEPDARGATSDTYVRVALVGADGSAADDEAAQSETVPKDTAEPEWEGELSLLLPENSVRPPLLRVSVWDKDWAAGTDAPLAVADVTLAAEPSGTMSTVKLPARDELGEIDISFEYEVAVAPADAAAVPPPPAAPAPREEVRVVQPSGFVVRRFADGSLQTYSRDGNVGNYAVSGQHAGCWVSTNAAGLRAGTTASGEAYFVPALGVATTTEPTTNHVLTTRSDGTLVLRRADMSRLVQHACGTSIEASAEAEKFPGRGDLIIRAPGFPDVKIDVRKGATTIVCADGSTLASGGGAVTLSHGGGAQLSLTAAGVAELRPEPLAWQDGRLPEDMSGVYTIDLSKGSLASTDPEGNELALTLGETPTLQRVLRDELVVAEEQSFATVEEAPEDPAWSLPPRLFVCRADGSGAELLRHPDVKAFIGQRAAGMEGGSGSLLQEALPGEEGAQAYSWVWRDAQELGRIAAADADAASDAQKLLGFMAAVKEEPPSASLLHVRRLVRREPLTLTQRIELDREIAALDDFRTEEGARMKELHVDDSRTAEEKAAEQELQNSLLEVRRPPDNAQRPARHAHFIHLTRRLGLHITPDVEDSAAAGLSAAAGRGMGMGWGRGASGGHTVCVVDQ